MFYDTRDKPFQDYLKLFARYIGSQQTEVYHNMNEFVVEKNGKEYHVRPPVFVDIDDEISRLECSLSKISNKELISEYVSNSIDIPLTDYLTLNELRLHKAKLQKAVKDQVIEFNRKVENLHTLRDKMKSLDSLSQPGEKHQICKEIIKITMDLIQASVVVPDRNSVPRFFAIKTLPTIEEKGDFKVHVGEKKPRKIIPLNKEEKVLDQIDRVKDKVISMLTPFRIFHEIFNTPDQCKSQARTKKYYVSKVDLIEMIKSKEKLRPKFPNIGKMNKDEICDRLFELSDNQSNH